MQRVGPSGAMKMTLNSNFIAATMIKIFYFL